MNRKACFGLGLALGSFGAWAVLVDRMFAPRWANWLRGLGYKVHKPEPERKPTALAA